MNKCKIVNIKLHKPIKKSKFISTNSNSFIHNTKLLLSNNTSRNSSFSHTQLNTDNSFSKLLRKKAVINNLQQRIKIILAQVENEKPKEKEQSFSKKNKERKNKVSIRLKDPNFYSSDKRFKVTHGLISRNKNKKKFVINDHFKQLGSLTKWNSVNSKMIKSYEKKTENDLTSNNHFIEPTQMNNAVIRDFGFKSQVIDNSKKNLALTDDFIDRRREKFKQRTSIIGVAFDKIKNNEFGAVDLAYNSNILSQIQDPYPDPLLLNGSTERLYLSTKLSHIEKINKKIVDTSKTFANLLFQMNHEEYQKMNVAHCAFSEPIINYNNLERGIKVHYIRKNKVELDNEEIVTRERFKKIKSETDEEISYLMRNTGVPHFVKKKFKEKTLRKYREVSGDYMGYPV